LKHSVCKSLVINCVIFLQAFLLCLIDQEKEAAKELEGVPDEEGWIKVTRLSKNTAAATSRTQSKDKRTKRKIKKWNREKVSKLVNL